MAEVFDFTRGDICWTTSPYNSIGLQEMPCIEMYGWQQTWSSTIASITRWLTRVKNLSDLGNPYEALYLGKPSNVYKLPYFSESHHNTTQKWEENNGPLGEEVKKLTDFTEVVAKTILPAAGILFPKAYAGSNPYSYNFTFNLINTNAGNGLSNEIEENVIKNQRFLESFIRDNLHGMNGSLSITPPLIYEIYIPGVRWSPAAVVSNFVVNNKGTLNKNKFGLIGTKAKRDYIYPDAWEVTIGITELINESKSIWDDAINGNGGLDNITTRVFTGQGVDQ
ncbi:MAG: hypothetical protein PHS54_00550 [Clostridia bacterium]|nr:hypothetical protein [Clostridia bacterium]